MKIANAPCSWGILEFGLEGNTDSYQTVLDEMALTGYRGTELGDWGFMPTDPSQLKQELESRELQLVGAFVPVNFVSTSDFETSVDDALKIASFLKDVDPENAKIVLADDNGKDGNRTQYAGRIKPEHCLDSDQQFRFNQRVEELSSRIQGETGLTSVFHHHCAGYIETPQEIEALLDQTDPKLVNLCFDTGHFAFGGGDPIEGLKRYSERIDHVHFKDWDESIFRQAEQNNWNYFEAVGNGIFCELGQGSINFEAVLSELYKQNYCDWIVVEQDILPGMGSPKESAERNREFLKSLGV